MASTPRFLKAGPIQVHYESGFLRYFKFGGTEVLRMVYFAVRDHNWLTIPIVVTDEVIRQDIDSFHLHFNWRTDSSLIQMAGYIAVHGEESGSVTVSFYGRALESFQKNRLGLCILHPIDGLLGQPVEVITPEGSLTSSNFPTVISPHQPFLDIQTMRWQATSGPVWQLDFSGDVFETEDQRNWSDASFKTYSTPLDNPFPVTVEVGEEFTQKVIFSRAKAGLTKPIYLPEVGKEDKIPSETKHAFPLIGVGQRTGGATLSASEAALLRTLKLAHLRADVFFNLPAWQVILTDAVADANAIEVPLELAVFFWQDPVIELQTLKQFFDNNPVSIRDILLFNADTLITSDRLLNIAVPVARTYWPDAAIGGGTDCSFAELNRNPFNVDLVDFLTYSINPQVHATDDLTLLENIAGQTETVVSARHLSGGKPVHISLVTLRPRFMTLSLAATERLTPVGDPRQIAPFGAYWTQQSISALSRAGVRSITYYQSHGPAGIVNDNTVYPVFAAFEDRCRPVF